MNKIIQLLIGLLLFNIYSFGQETFPVQGINDERTNSYLFKNATIVVDYKTTIDDSDLLIKKGLIINIGKNLKATEGTIVVDLDGKYIYPSLIDIYTNYGLPKTPAASGQGMMFFGRTATQVISGTKGAFNWNEAIKSYIDVSEIFNKDEKLAAEYRKLGFGTVLSINPDGLARGSSALVSLSDTKENKLIINPKAAAHYSFNKGSSKQNYPSSLFGIIALLRQTYYDAEWYNEQNNQNIHDESLDAWNSLQKLPQIFEVNDKFSIMRAVRLGEEFGKKYIVKGNGDEYQNIKEIEATGTALIIPINFPKAPDVKDPYETLNISLASLKHWELAPGNPACLQDKNIEFSLTSAGLKAKSDFWPMLRKAIEFGLDEQSALKALSYTPAKLLNAETKIGSLKKGMLANFLICSGNLFDKELVLFENWIQGKKFVINEMNIFDYSGIYDLNADNKNYVLEFSGKPEKPVIKLVIDDTTKLITKSAIKNELIFISFNPDQKNKNAGDIRLSGWITGKSMKGTGQLADGSWINWNAEYKRELKTARKKPADTKKKSTDKKETGKVIYPFMAYGSEELPEAKDILFKNATVWTNEKEGILKNTDVLIRSGKIVQIGKNINAGTVIEIDGTGKHLSPGVIDEHSHIAGAGGLNEGSHAVTPEVRVGDVIDSEDISIYRQLAGGVTAAQCLHGSANPIGGQSQIIKHRWGRTPEELKVKNTVGFLKHALGENVKQSRSPAWLSSRYPQTRMGVEQIIKDAYTMAIDYRKKWDKYNSMPDDKRTLAKRPRKDMRMEALVDVLEKRSFMTCHTYVQSETNMIMKLAEEFGIKAHTLIHNTEGYMLADKMKEHGAMGSLLPDWWAYKWEVYNAIPYNAALNLELGLVTCIHSDNAELAARLNQEAAKAVKYGNVSEEEALKLVTLNPAIILHIDDRTGSIKAGKDADLVLWSDNPLSIYTKAEVTMVDGIIYYDLDKHEKLMESNKNERARLVKKILNEQPASPVAKAGMKK